MDILKILNDALANYGGDTKGIIQSLSVSKECGVVNVRLCSGNTFAITATMTPNQMPVDIDSGEEISFEEWNKKFGKKYGFVI